jgi:O-antigen/teichoic acid export membrane protein
VLDKERDRARSGGIAAALLYPAHGFGLSREHQPGDGRPGVGSVNDDPRENRHLFAMLTFHHGPRKASMAHSTGERLSRTILEAIARMVSSRLRNVAFVDQILVSAGNFLGGILLARAFGVHDYGRFVLAWMLIEFIASLQIAAVIQPMLNIGAKQAEAKLDTYYHAVLIQQWALCLAFAAVVWIAAAVSGRFFANAEGLAASLCAAAIAYQLYNFFRRYLFARDRPMAALAVDVLRFAVQIAATLALPFLWPDASAGAGIWIVTAASAAAALLGALQFGRLRWNSTVLREVTVRHWHFSKWLLPSAVMSWLTSQAFFVLCGIVLGATAVGSLRAAASIVGVLNILLLALDNFAPVQASRALHRGGRVQLLGYIAQLSSSTFALTVIVVGILNLAPGYIVHLLYGDQYAGITDLVRWLCAPYVVGSISTVLVIWAAAMEWTRTVFISYVAAVVFTGVAAYPLTRYGGLVGIVVGALLMEIVRVVALAVPLARWSRAAGHETSETAHSVQLAEPLTNDRAEARPLSHTASP